MLEQEEEDQPPAYEHEQLPTYDESEAQVNSQGNQ